MFQKLQKSSRKNLGAPLAFAIESALGLNDVFVNSSVDAE
jgi:hypothetical protein